MKNKLNIFLVVFALNYAAFADDTAVPAGAPGQVPEQTLRETQAKLGQMRALSSEIQVFLKQQADRLVQTKKNKEQSRKNDELADETARATADVKKEIEKVRDETRECEKLLDAQSKQMKQVVSAQAELESARQDRLASESKLKQVEENLQNAQKTVADMKQKLSELMKHASEAKDQKQNLQNASSALERERTKKAEVISRAEKGVGMFEAVEKERLRLATQIAELEQAILPKQQDIAEREKIAGEIESEKKLVLETQEKIRNDEIAIAKAERAVADLKKQLLDRKKAAAAAARPEEMKMLKSDLEKAKISRDDAEFRLKNCDARRRQTLAEIASLSNQIAETSSPDAEMRKTSALMEQLTVELDNENKGLAEVEEKIARTEKAKKDAEIEAANLKKALAERKKTAALSDKTEDMNRLKANLDNIRKDRAEAQARLKEADAKLLEAEKSLLATKDMIAEAATRQEHNMATMKVVADMTGELEAEKAAREQLVASIEKKCSAMKAMEEENAKLKNSFRDVTRELEKTGEVTNRLNEIRLQLADQQKLRKSIEEKVRDAGQKQDGLEKDLEQLRKAIANAGEQIKRNDEALKTAEGVDAELRQEKSNIRKSESLIKDREQAVGRMAAEKSALEKKLKDAEIKLAEQLKQNKVVEDMRRQLADEKKARLAAEKKSAELARAEQEYRDQLKELNEKMRVTTKKSQAALRAVDTSDADESFQVAGKSESKLADTGQPEAAVRASSQDPLTEEQKLLKAARSGDSRSQAGDAGASQVQAPLEKSNPEHRRATSLEEADAHYAVGIQKWDEQDMEGAMEEFKKTVQLNPDAAGAYYNLALASFKLNNKNDACDYAYKAGISYIRTGNLPQATRMVVLIGKINQQSPLIEKLREKVAAATSSK